MEAGARPWKSTHGKQKRRRGRVAAIFVKVRPIVAVITLLAGLLVGFSPDLRNKVTTKLGDVKDSTMSKLHPRYAPIAPVDLSVTSETPDNPGTNVIDGNTISFWVAPGSDAEPTIVVRFDEPFNLERIKLWNGAAVGFKEHRRVKDIHMVFDTGQSYDLTVKDLPEGVEYEVKNGKGIRSLELHVTGFYNSLSGDKLGVSEIEFFFRR